MKRDFLNKVIDEAILLGAQEVEIFLHTSKGISIEVKELNLESMESSHSFGYGVRIIKDAKVGFSYSTNYDDYKDVVKRAIASSKYVVAQDFNRLPKAHQHQCRSDIEIYDEKINLLKTDEALDMVLQMERSARKERLVNKVRKAEGSFGVKEVFIQNSLGINNYYKSTYANAHILLMAEKDGDRHTGWDFQANRFIDKINFEEIGLNAAMRATTMLGAKKISSMKGLVVLENINAISFLGLLSSSFNAESVQKGRSILKGKIGERILSDKIDIVDDASISGLLGTRPFDAEGVPTGQTIVVDKGVLKAFLYNSLTALKDGVSSTGNAVRASYTSIPSVGINNLFIKASKDTPTMSKEEIMKTVDKGIYITEILGMHTANPITGEFSLGVSGLWIHGGAFKYPFKEATISGNVFDLFNNIASVGDDMRFYVNIGAPTLLIEGVDISS